MPELIQAMTMRPWPYPEGPFRLAQFIGVCKNCHLMLAYGELSYVSYAMWYHFYSGEVSCHLDNDGAEPFIYEIEEIP